MLGSPPAPRLKGSLRMSWNPHGHYSTAKWYVCIWQAIWFVPAELLSALYLLTILIGWGPRAAREVIRMLYRE